jgi:hypothetical protein
MIIPVLRLDAGIILSSFKVEKGPPLPAKVFKPSSFLPGGRTRQSLCIPTISVYQILNFGQIGEMRRGLTREFISGK